MGPGPARARAHSSILLFLEAYNCFYKHTTVSGRLPTVSGRLPTVSGRLPTVSGT